MRAALQACPLLVSGERRLDYDLSSYFGSRIVCKGGAEGLQAVGFSDPPLGVVVKVLDGQSRALAPIVMAVLAELGLFDATHATPLERYVRPKLRNLAGVPTGEVVARVRLEPVS
jgi:L-asparaginase II